MKKHLARARSQLGELHGLASKTERAEHRILKQAERRHAEVTAAIERARPGIEAAPDAAQQRYLDLVSERAQLDIVMARARQALGEQP